MKGREAVAIIFEGNRGRKYKTWLLKDNSIHLTFLILSIFITVEYERKRGGNYNI